MYRPWAQFEPWSNKTVLFSCTLALSIPTEVSHLAEGFLHVNLGCPVAPLPLLSCQPGFLLKIPLKVWGQLGEVCVLFQLALDRTSQSKREAGDLAPALFQQLQLQGTTGGVSSYAACTPCLTNEQAGFLPCSRGCLFVQTTTRGPSFCHHLLLALPLWPCVPLKVKWQLSCVGRFASWSPTAGSSAPTDAPKNSAATARGSQETEPMSMLWVLGALNTFWGSVCAMVISCLIKMALILGTKVLQPHTKPTSPPTPYLAASAWGRTCE